MPQNLIKVKNKQGIYYLESKNRRFNGKSDKCFYITYRNNANKFVREKVGWESEGYSNKMAVHVRSERLRTIRHGLDLPSKKKDPTFEQIWEEYDKWLDAPDSKKHIYDDRNRYQKHIKSKYASKTISHISTLSLQKFKTQLFNKGLAPSTVKHVLVLMRQIINKSIEWGLWEGKNPIKGVKLPKLNNKRERFLTHEEAYELLDKIEKTSDQTHEMATISLHTGARAGEIFALRWCDIDVQNKIINIPDPKGGISRKAFMTNKVKFIFKNKQSGQPEELVFKNSKGKLIKEISNTFPRIVEKLKFNHGITDRRQLVSFHTLRHTFASWLAIQGTHLLVIKELLGHKTLVMTERYAHLIPDQKKESVEKMEQLFNASQMSEPDASESKHPDQ